ncbi:MAG: hypothetical protein FWC44_02305 [Methanomassiliicoccaceae archaeon]|nr:hypothetical protein [Methanomassiliicoccaceae archaeon]
MSSSKIYGWIPNIEGKVCSPERVRSKFAAVEELYNSDKEAYKKEYEQTYACDGSGKRITISHEQYGTVVIEALDKDGLCSIEITERKKDDAMATEVWVSKVWKEFRKIMDGCSNTLCDCTAMVPIYLEESEKTSVHEKIAETFIDALEQLSDGGNYILEPEISGPSPKNLIIWSGMAERSMKFSNIAKSNILYFDRFMDMYKDEFGKKAAKEYRKIMNSMGENARMIYESNMRKSEYGFKTQSASNRNNLMALSAIALGVIALCVVVLFIR